jgi:hypothetical protein
MAYTTYNNATTGNVSLGLGSKPTTLFTLTGGGGSLSPSSVYTGTGGAWSTTATMSSPTLEVSGDATFKGNIKVKGRNLTDWLETIDSRLGILQTNPDLEKEFDELKALGDAYREAERRFLEQKRVYEILKTTDE